MRTIVMLSMLLLLAGCGNDKDEWKEVFDMMEDGCVGELSTTVTHGEWNSSISMTCVEIREEVEK